MSPQRYTGEARSTLEAAMMSRGITAWKLSRTLDIAYPSVWRVMAGASAMTKARAERYAAALAELGVSVRWHEIM